MNLDEDFKAAIQKLQLKSILKMENLSKRIEVIKKEPNGNDRTCWVVSILECR